MPINGLSTARRLPRLGKIHLGYKHPQKGYPVKTDYFVCPPEVHKIYGEQPKELPIFIPVEDDEKFASQYYRAYSQTRGLICKGDGELANRLCRKGTDKMADKEAEEVEMKTVPCMGKECEYYKYNKCKPIMNLQFMLPEVPGLGVYQIDTSSVNSIIQINSMIDLVKGLYGRISMIPLLLTLEPKDVTPEDGKKKTIYTLNLRSGQRMEDLALRARKTQEMFMLPVGDDEAPDCIDEFEPLPPPTTTVQEDIDQLWPNDEKPPVEVKAEPQKTIEKPPQDEAEKIWDDLERKDAKPETELMATKVQLDQLKAIHEKNPRVNLKKQAESHGWKIKKMDDITFKMAEVLIKELS